MRFGLGVLVGVVLGAGAMWAARRQWQSAPAPVVALAADAGAAADPPDRRRKRGHRRAGRGPGDPGGPANPSEPPPPTLGAADRQMVWRGAAISLPTRTVDLGSGGDGRSLESDEINPVIQRSSDPVLACIEQSRAGALLGGDVRLELLVDGGGAVGKVRVGAPRWLIEHGLADCATAAARRFRFPATGAATIVDAPYHLD